MGLEFEFDDGEREREVEQCVSDAGTSCFRSVKEKKRT